MPRRADRHLVLPVRSFPASVAGARAERSMTSHALAEQAGVARASVEDLELGELVDRDDLEAICRTLGLALPELLDSALVQFGALLRDRRDRVGLSRKKLGSLAGLSDCTIKFIETARQPPSRRSCPRLVGVKSLNLRWADLAAFGGPDPAPGATDGDDTRTASASGDEVASPETDAAPQTTEPGEPSTELRRMPRSTRPLIKVLILVFASGRVTLSIDPQKQR